jgi:HEAT repeat protein
MKLQHVLTSVAQSTVSLDQLRALRLLLGFDHIADETLSVVRPLSQSGDPDIALTALGVLLRTKSVDSVQKLRQYLESYTADAEPSALFVIGPELREISNPNALLALEALSRSKFRSVQSGAMDGIRRIRDPKSVPFLMAKLGDPDSDVQYVALITAAEILGKYEGDFAPSMYLFDKNPQYYIGLWKQWWVEEGSKLYSARDFPSPRAE